MKFESRTLKLNAKTKRILTQWESDFRSVLTVGDRDQDILETLASIRNIRKLGFINAASAGFLIGLAKMHLSNSVSPVEVRREADALKNFIERKFETHSIGEGCSISFIKAG